MIAPLDVPPMFQDFRCLSSEQSLNQCRNPTGATASVITCGYNVMGIQCAGILCVYTFHLKNIVYIKGIRKG